MTPGDVSPGGARGSGPRVAVLCRILWNGGVQRVAIAQTQALRRLGIPASLFFLRRVAEVAFDLPPGTFFFADPVQAGALVRLQGCITTLFAKHRGLDAWPSD